MQLWCVYIVTGVRIFASALIVCHCQRERGGYQHGRCDRGQWAPPYPTYLYIVALVQTWMKVSPALRLSSGMPSAIRKADVKMPATAH